jgi:hypothetical protein
MVGSAALSNRCSADDLGRGRQMKNQFSQASWCGLVNVNPE